MQIRRVSIGHGARWVGDAISLFRAQALPWIVLHLAFMLIGMGLGVLAPVGPMILLLLTPVFMAGLMLGCREQEQGQVVEIAHLFRGFRQQASQLVTIGGIYLVGQILIFFLVMRIGGPGLDELARAVAENQEPAQIHPDAADRASLALLVGSALFLPLAMAVWFAPALVVLEGQSAWRAMQWSLRACLVNVLPLLLYGIVMFGLLLIALLPLMAGLVLWIPLAMLSVYTAYRDIFAWSEQKTPTSEGQ
jgi:hypothetical protein